MNEEHGNESSPPAEHELRARVRELEHKLVELDQRNLELERMAAKRGVKLSCANIALSRAKIAFDEAAKRREDLIQEVSHDLRTPLTSIKGAAQNLLDGIAGPLNDDAREYVEITRDHADRLMGIVNWLLEAMSVSAQPLELETAEVNLVSLARDVVRSLAPIAQERGITLLHRTDVNEASALVDEARLRQVLENLVGNALKFTEAEGSVCVGVQSDEESVFLSVRDTGIGMSPEEANQVFDRYYRRGSSQGSRGLGLAISREIVRLHGGNIHVKTRQGEGSEFIVSLPRTP